MKYNFKYQTTAKELWKLSVYGIYGSMVGVINIIFTVAMVLLAAKFWANVNTFFKVLLIIGISLFTVIQPIAIYLRAKKVALSIPEDMEIGFDDKGVHVKASNKSSSLKWSKIRGVTKKRSMIIIFTSNTHGFIISNKALGAEKEEFYDYVTSKIKR